MDGTGATAGVTVIAGAAAGAGGGVAFTLSVATGTVGEKPTVDPPTVTVGVPAIVPRT